MHTNTAKEDFLFNYHKSKLSLGLILLEFSVAIKAGDEDRLHDHYKTALLNRKTKYSYALLMNLLQVECMLSQEEAPDLEWNRFFNKHGKKWKNYSA